MCGGPLCLEALILGSNSDSSVSEVHPPPRPHPHVLSDILVSRCPHLPWLITKSFFLEPALEAPSYIAADIQPDKLASLALPSSGLLSTGWHVWALPSPLQAHFRLLSSDRTAHMPLPGPCPPVLSRNLQPSPPSHAPELLRSSPPPSPTPAWTCPLLPGSGHTAVLGGSVVMHHSLSSKLSLPHSTDRAFSSFYLQLLFYVGSCCPPPTKSITFSQMLVERKGAFNQDAGHLGRGRAEHMLETPLRSCLAMNVLKGRRGVI